MILYLFDTETTGVNTASCGVVSAALVRRDIANETETIVVNELCNPGHPIPAGASGVHGIYDADVAPFGCHTLLMKRTFDFIAADLSAGHEVYLCGHNLIAYDLPILERLAGKTFKGTELRLLDTLKLGRALVPESPKHNLSTLYTHLTGKEPANAHNALADVQMCYEILMVISMRTSKTLDELRNDRQPARILDKCPFGMHKGKKFGIGPELSHVPKSWVVWLKANAENLSEDLVATFQHHYGV